MQVKARQDGAPRRPLPCPDPITASGYGFTRPRATASRAASAFVDTSIFS